MTTVLIADDDPTTRKILLRMLKPDYNTEAFADGEQALAYFVDQGADIIITDLKMPQMDGLELLQKARKIDPEIIVFVVTGFASVDTAVRAMKDGAYDYLAKPFDPDDVQIRIGRALKEKNLAKECSVYRMEKEREDRRHEIITRDPDMLRLLELAQRVARADSTVLIQGETGVGKELLARQIHRWSPRGQAPFIPVNCSALAEGIMESELFGHEKGAFTGAHSRRIGFFEMADQGTLLLDEIGTADQRFQVKLLRVLQDRIIYSVGSPKARKIDVRIIAATNQDLEQESRENTFRPDLYYRLSVVTLQIPPLRDRLGDIPPLADYFLAKYRHINPAVDNISPGSMAVLAQYAYPGNVRELENIIERAMIIETGSSLQPESLLIYGKEETTSPPSEAPSGLEMKEAEKNHILHVLATCDGKKLAAARMLGINKTTLWRKMKKYGIGNG